MVCLWLKALHPSLPSLVKQRYATQLKDCTLASIREEISGCVSELLAELGEKESVPNPSVYQANSYNRPNSYSGPRGNNYQRPRFPNARYQYNPRQNQGYGNYQPRFPQHNNPSCPICKQAGRKDYSHTLSLCPFLPPSDKRMLENNRARLIDCDQFNQNDEFY